MKRKGSEGVGRVEGPVTHFLVCYLLDPFLLPHTNPKSEIMMKRNDMMGKEKRKNENRHKDGLDEL